MTRWTLDSINFWQCLLKNVSCRFCLTGQISSLTVINYSNSSRIFQITPQHGWNYEHQQGCYRHPLPNMIYREGNTPIGNTRQTHPGVEKESRDSVSRFPTFTCCREWTQTDWGASQPRSICCPPWGFTTPKQRPSMTGNTPTQM